MLDITDTDSCDCNTHQEHIMELTNDHSAFPLPVYENLLKDYSGNCVICNLKLSSTNCRRHHECSCPSDMAIILESCSLINIASKTPVLKKKKIGPNPVGNLNAIVNLTETEAQKNLSKSKAKKQVVLPPPVEYIDLDSVSSASLYAQPKQEDINCLLENVDTFQFNTAMTESAINELIENNNNPIWGIDNMLQTMTDKSSRILEWIAGTKSSCSATSIPSSGIIPDYEDEFAKCIAYSVEDSSSNSDSSLPEVILPDNSEVYEIKSSYSSTPESPAISDQGDFYIKKRVYESTTDDDCSIFEEKKAKTSP